MSRCQISHLRLVLLTALSLWQGQAVSWAAPPKTATLKRNTAATSPSVDQQVETLLSRMTLAEKIGQMTQVEKEAINATPQDIARLGIGSILSGGGQAPTPNNKVAWADMTDAFQRHALSSRLSIPVLYGIDAIHGHNNLKDAVMFPHFIGLGATRDAELVKAIAKATAEEVAATGIRWNFAPSASLPQDLRWGRVYEAFSEDTDLVADLDVAYITGLQGDGLSDAAHSTGPQRAQVLATSKHFIGDGAAEFGTGRDNLVDRGDARIDEATLRRVHLPPYLAAMAAGVETIMVSYSSWNGVKMHASRHLLTDVLKGELGFKGFLISDWKALDEMGSHERENIKTAILAGLDMVMVPTRYESFISNLEALVQAGEVPMERIDDAVRRILRVKMRLGLFQQPFADRSLLDSVASAEHRQLARTAAARSQVLLKNEHNTLPLSKNASTLLVAGEGADDLGLQCGGWTIEWQGARGHLTTGVTLLQGIRSAVATSTTVNYSRDGQHSGDKVPVGIAVVAETPYAEFHGDVTAPVLRPEDQAMLTRMRAASERLVVIVLSGRPMLMTEAIADADAVVAAFLPGTEGGGVADVLFGDQAFTGTLPFAWPRTAEALARSQRNASNTLYPFGHGLQTTKLIRTSERSPESDAQERKIFR